MSQRVLRLGGRGVIVSAVAIASSLAIAAGATASATATVKFKNLGTSAPPTKLGGFKMHQFPIDTRTDGTAVTSVSGQGHTITFGSTVYKETIGHGWNTWSNGYTGSVYVNTSSSLKLHVSPGVSAFYLYVEPDHYSTYTVTVSTKHGTVSSGPINVAGNGGANGFGFSSKTGAINAVTITTSDTAFAVGEFGVSKSAP